MIVGRGRGYTVLMRPIPPLTVALLLPLAACSRAVNLLQPDAPAFRGEYGRAPAAAADLGRPDRLRVVSFNIKWGREIDAAIAMLRSLPLAGADVIALQEMDSAGVDSIARALRMNYAYFPSSRHPTVGYGYFGPAVLSPWPIERSWKVMLPGRSLSRRQQRTATGVVLRIGPTRVRAYSLHLEHPAQMLEETRRRQALAVLADAAGADPGEPVVIAGDFNSRETAAYVALSGWQWATRGIGPTVGGLFAFDHILACGLAAESPTRVGRAPDPNNASDHLPVWADLVFTASCLAPPHGAR